MTKRTRNVLIALALVILSMLACELTDPIVGGYVWNPDTHTGTCTVAGSYKSSNDAGDITCRMPAQ